jgi:hypothetical protein
MASEDIHVSTLPLVSCQNVTSREIGATVLEKEFEPGPECQWKLNAYIATMRSFIGI